MGLVHERYKTRNGDGHPVTLTHTVNTASPPHTVYMPHNDRNGRALRVPPSPAVCPDCGQPLRDWPFCPHDGRPKRAA